jgi:EmrB/QacA subfamily drug resistance transporter
MTATPMAQTTTSDRVLTPEILSLAAVVVLGSIMTILDATIVNVALATLGREFEASISTIQWVATIYLLAFASVIPLTGWASERFGAKRVWLASLTVFMLGSLLSGLAWSVGALIAFRALQGAGAGMIMPLGQSILAREAGPQRIGRVMTIVGVPMLLAPIFGPVIGGALVDGASWRWIFFVNLPVGAAALALAARLLPNVEGRRLERLDVLGIPLLSGGIALFVFGLSETATRGSMLDPVTLTTVVAGLALLAAFAWHALRTDSALIDVRLFGEKAFATAALTNLVLGVALFGMLILLPLYFQIVRGASPLETGVLMIPQGVGAALAMPVAGILTDRLGARRVVPIGVLVALVGVVAYTQIGADTPYWYLAAALFVIGLGLGATIMPSMGAAYAGLTHAQMPRATSAINAIQRIAGSLGTALLAVVLQRTLRGEHTADAQAAAFGATFWVAFALTAAALVPALLLPRRLAQHPAVTGG